MQLSWNSIRTSHHREQGWVGESGGCRLRLATDKCDETFPRSRFSRVFVAVVKANTLKLQLTSMKSSTVSQYSCSHSASFPIFPNLESSPETCCCTWTKSSRLFLGFRHLTPSIANRMMLASVLIGMVWVHLSPCGAWTQR